MSTKGEDLQRCPFCKERNEYTKRGKLVAGCEGLEVICISNRDDQKYVSCRKCGATGPISDHADHRADGEARENWNRREWPIEQIRQQFCATCRANADCIFYGKRNPNCPDMKKLNGYLDRLTGGSGYV